MIKCSRPATSKHTSVDPSTAIADTGTTGNFLCTHSPCINKQPDNNPIAVKLPNGQLIYNTHTAELPNVNIPEAARKAYIFPDLNGHALLSIGLLADNGCTTALDSSSITISHNNNIILEGK